jgi:hypothetical protein
VKKQDMTLDELHANRRIIENEIKKMTRSERTAYFNQAGEAAAQKYGFRRVTGAKQKV